MRCQGVGVLFAAAITSPRSGHGAMPTPIVRPGEQKASKRRSDSVPHTSLPPQPSKNKDVLPAFPIRRISPRDISTDQLQTLGTIHSRCGKDLGMNFMELLQLAMEQGHHAYNDVHDAVPRQLLSPEHKVSALPARNTLPWLKNSSPSLSRNDLTGAESMGGRPTSSSCANSSNRSAYWSSSWMKTSPPQCRPQQIKTGQASLGVHKTGHEPRALNRRTRLIRAGGMEQVKFRTKVRFRACCP